MSRVSYIANFQIYIGINSFVHIALPYCVLYIKTSLFITSSRWRNGSCGTCCCSVWCSVWDVSASYRLRWNTANQAYAWVTGSRPHTHQQSRISTEWNINIQIKQDPDKEVTQCKDCSLGKCRHVHRLRSTTQHLTTGHSSTWSLCLNAAVQFYPCSYMNITLQPYTKKSIFNIPDKSSRSWNVLKTAP